MKFKSKFLGRIRVSKSPAKPPQKAYQDSVSPLYDEQVEVRADPIDIEECRDDLNPMEMFLSNASSTFSGVFGEAQSMAEDIYTIATAGVEEDIQSIAHFLEGDTQSITLETEEKQVGEIQEELKAVKVELDNAMNVIQQKSARISHLEQSLDNAKSSVLHLIQEHERAQANIEKQKESLGILISQQINAEKDAKTSFLKTSLLVDAIDVSQCSSTAVEQNLEKAVAEEEVPSKTVEEVVGERLDLAEESQ